MQVITLIKNFNVASWSLNVEEKILTVERVEIHLEKHVFDYQNIVTITNNDGQAVIGIEGRQGYIADVEIPPREYEEIEVEKTGEENSTTEIVPLPLNLEAVILKLWPYGEEENNEEINEEEAL